MDARLRDQVRAAQRDGDPAAEGRALVERLRVDVVCPTCGNQPYPEGPGGYCTDCGNEGFTFLGRVALAAILGDPGAQAALPDEARGFGVPVFTDGPCPGCTWHLIHRYACRQVKLEELANALMHWDVLTIWRIQFAAAITYARKAWREPQDQALRPSDPDGEILQAIFLFLQAPNLQRWTRMRGAGIANGRWMRGAGIATGWHERWIPAVNDPLFSFDLARRMPVWAGHPAPGLVSEQLTMCARYLGRETMMAEIRREVVPWLLR